MKAISKFLSFFICGANLMFAGCAGINVPNFSGENQQTHVCSFEKQKAESQYLKTEATCERQAEYYYSCKCGKAGTETFTSGKLKVCDFTNEVVEDEYLTNLGN